MVHLFNMGLIVLSLRSVDYAEPVNVYK